MSEGPLTAPKYPAAKNIGAVVRQYKNGKYTFRDPDVESTGIVTDIVPLGYAMGV